ncbi:MAG: MFS transporter [Candidatus Omnitrophota bacterium]
MSKFHEVLSNRNFFLLWLGQIISQLGDRLGFMALIGFAYSKKAQGSPAEIFKILLFTIVPVFLIGPIAGAYVDRWDRRRTMYMCDFLRMLLVGTLPLFLFHARNLSIAYLLIFIIFCIARFFLPAKLSIVPDLVKNHDLLIANSLVNITGMIAFVVGSGIGGVVVELAGVENGFYLDALSFLVSGTLIFFITQKSSVAMNFRKVSGDIVQVIKKSLIQEIKEGVMYFISKKDIRLTAGVLFILASALGVVSVVSIVFVQNTLHSATKGLGLLIMFLGAGLFLGALVYGRFGSRISHYKMIFTSLILSGIMLIVFVLGLKYYPNFLSAALLSFLLGLFSSPILIASNTIIHKASDNKMRGKIFSSLEMVMHLGFLLNMYLSTFLAQRYSHVLILVVIGCLFSVLGAISLIVNRKISWLD